MDAIALERLQGCVGGAIYAIPKRADVVLLLDEHVQLAEDLAISDASLWASMREADTLRGQLREAQASAQASAELASTYARQLVRRPSWAEFWAVLALLPMTFTIASLGTSWSLVSYPR